MFTRLKRLPSPALVNLRHRPDPRRGRRVVRDRGAQPPRQEGREEDLEEGREQADHEAGAEVVREPREQRKHRGHGGQRRQARGSAGFLLRAGDDAATALVAANGTVDAAHSDGVGGANVTQPVGGVYCFNGLSPATRSVVASVAGGQATVQTQVQYTPTGGLCAGSQFDVATVTDANALFPEAFTVFIH